MYIAVCEDCGKELEYVLGPLRIWQENHGVTLRYQAFQSAADLDPTRKWISLYSRIRQDNLLIEINNPYEGDVTIRDGMPVSHRDGHGYGCRSICSIAGKNNGICLFETEGGIFTLRVVLPVRHP